MEDLLSSSGYSLEKQSILGYIQEPTETIGRYYDFVKKQPLFFFYCAIFHLFFYLSNNQGKRIPDLEKLR